MRWNEYKTLLIISASLLWQTGEQLRSRDFEETAECIRLRSEILEAVESIYSSAASLFPTKITELMSTSRSMGVGSIEMIYVFSALWPLYCASRVRGVPEIQRECLRNMLRQVGEAAKIPLALSLV